MRISILFKEEDSDLISEDELVKRAKEIDTLHRNGTLVRAKSLGDLIFTSR